MLQRCCNPANAQFGWYGARGIRVCERWQSFECFLADMGLRPSDAHTLDREDNDGDYEPGNCRWATWEQQSANRRSNKYLDVEGREMCISHAARHLGMPDLRLRTRLAKGWEGERLLAPPEARTVYEYKGLKATLSVLCREHGADEHVVRMRLSSGWEIERALAEPIKRVSVRWRGREVRLSVLCRELGLPVALVAERLRCGWKLKRALTPPEESLAAKCRRLGVPVGRVKMRVRLGWDLDRALTEPKTARGPRPRPERADD
jgi:hypothetical protein